MDKKKLIEAAQHVLNNNFQQEGFTIPCEGLYPFQWKWDSGFIAIGYAYYDIAKSKKEIETLLNAQWENGFIPHIVFHTDSDTYFPGPDFHKSELHPKSSTEFRSTGMTQPPITGFILEEMYRIVEDKEDMLLFIKNHIDKVYQNHEYFYKYRDPNQEGLVYIYHNWESGTDNSPMWDDIWETMDPPEYEFERRDTTHVDPAQRPSKREYDHYLHIIEIAKSHGYDDKAIARSSPFLVQDPLFNAMLIRSNKSLINLYRLLGDEHKIKQLEYWNQKSIQRYNEKLFDNEINAYVHYDLRNEKQIPHVCSSSFAALFAGIPDKRKADLIVGTMQERFGGEDKYLCASFDPTNKKFNPKKYWRGPVWINLNWMLYYGLKMYGYNELSDRVKNDSVELIQKAGFYEYFDCRKEIYKTENQGGYGGNNFSWSAALLLDLLNN